MRCTRDWQTAWERGYYLCTLVPGHPNYNPSESNLIPRPQSRYTATSLPGHPNLILPGHHNPIPRASKHLFFSCWQLVRRVFQPHSYPDAWGRPHPLSCFFTCSAIHPPTVRWWGLGPRLSRVEGLVACSDNRPCTFLQKIGWMMVCKPVWFCNWG